MSVSVRPVCIVRAEISGLGMMEPWVASVGMNASLLAYSFGLRACSEEVGLVSVGNPSRRRYYYQYSRDRGTCQSRYGTQIIGRAVGVGGWGRFRGILAARGYFDAKLGKVRMGVKGLDRKLASDVHGPWIPAFGMTAVMQRSPCAGMTGTAVGSVGVYFHSNDGRGGSSALSSCHGTTRRAIVRRSWDSDTTPVRGRRLFCR